MSSLAPSPSATSPFARAASAALDGWLARHPVEATFLGEHRHDRELDDPSRAAAARRAAEVRAQLAGIHTLDDPSPGGSPDERVDLEVLRTTLAAELFEIDELDEASWNPMRHNPGSALYALAVRPFAPAGDRLGSARARLSAVPDYLAAARERLDTMSRAHIETAIGQLDGTISLIDDALPQLAAEAGGALGDGADRARAAVERHQAWLRERLDSATRDPRLGGERFAAKLALTLDTRADPESLLARAEADLDRLGAEIADAAVRYAEKAGTAGTAGASPAEVLAELARDAPTDDTVLDVCRDAMTRATAFVREHDLMTVFDDPVEIIEMPEIDRGVAGAYCNPAGPLEQARLATEFAVSPTPAGWDAEQIASYYREYNRHMLHNLTVHEAMPGHALQLMHSNRSPASTPVRAVFGSGSFIEGWAVYAEQLMADRGYRSDESPRAALAHRLQQLKMQLRSTLNTILDIRFHCDDLDQAAAAELLSRRGFQEHGEITEKWRRVQLTSTQLCTYYVGFCEVRDLVADLTRAHPDWSERRRHDAVLGHGSPPTRHLRALIG